MGPENAGRPSSQVMLMVLVQGHTSRATASEQTVRTMLGFVQRAGEGRRHGVLG